VEGWQANFCPNSPPLEGWQAKPDGVVITSNNPNVNLVYYIIKEI
jgi:hypothetical protein